MNCDACLELLDLTIGGTLAGDAEAAAVGVDAAQSQRLAEHVEACASCAAERDALAATAAELERALAPAPGDARATEDLVAAVRAATAAPRIGAGGRRGWWAGALGAAAAALLVGVLYRSDRNPAADGRPAGATALAYPMAPPPVDDYTGPRFEDVTARAGVGAVDHTGEALRKDWMIESVGHGAAVLDADGDGDLDLFVPDGNLLDPTQRVAHTWKLYRNDGDLRFTDVSASSGLDLDEFGCCAVAGDVDGDGLTDLFVGCFGQNRLFMGRGDCRFEDASEAARVTGRQDDWSVAATLSDLDGDGDLDLYVANYADFGLYRSTRPEVRGCNWKEMSVPCGPQNLVPQRDRLYLNDGHGVFDDVSERLPALGRFSFQPVALDFSGDGRPDLFVAADAHPNQLLMDRGDGRYVDQALAAGVASDSSGHEQACMGVGVGDMDGDGQFDLVITNFSHEPNVFYAGRGTRSGVPVFSDVTAPAGMSRPSQMTLGWGVGLVDMDCDGDLDVVTANGHLYPDVQEHVPETSYAQHISLLENDGAGRLREVSGSAGVALTTPRVHRGLVIADFDDDGRPDAFATVLNGAAVLLHNDGRGAGRGVLLDLRRADGRTEAPGARVTVRVRDGDRERELLRTSLLGSSFASSEDPRVHVGLGRAGVVTALTVRWPTGVIEEFPAIGDGSVFRLVEGTGTVARLR